MKLRLALLAALLIAAALPAGAHAIGKVPAGAVWTEAYIESTDGVKLHADVLRPKHLGDTPSPVILSIGPYFNKSGQVGPVGPALDAPYDPVGPSDGPSERFHDLIEGAKLMERGYTVVLVDLRGYGGSTGCLDWVGPGEQADVVKSVEWAASQPWSTGKVGMYGKSYDGSTGLVGVNKQPKGLAAVVSQEPVYDMYRYLYGDGLRRSNSLLTPALYDAIDLTPGPLADMAKDPMYNINGANDIQRPGCKPLNWLDQAANEDHYSPYWRARNLITGAKGSTVPLFLMQGLTENNTVADGMAQYLENHEGPERAWLGPWNHIRGNETKGGVGIAGRDTWFDEVVRFYDKYLKGENSSVKDPDMAVQTNDGTWRDEKSWPPADSKMFETDLRGGRYTDDGEGRVTSNQGIWTVSQPLDREVILSGGGKLEVDVVTSLPRSGLVVDVYDLDEDGVGPLITRQGHMIHRNGRLELDLWSADWKIAKGHRIGVRITDANTDWWQLQNPSGATVDVISAQIRLPFLMGSRNKTIEGRESLELGAYLGSVVRVPAATMQAAQQEFALPPRA